MTPAERASERTDTERLDWLSARDASIVTIGRNGFGDFGYCVQTQASGGRFIRVTDVYPTYRAAVDAAMDVEATP